MRPAVFATSCLGLLAACEPSAKVDPVTVQWMDWPAEVKAGQPFRTRLVVWNVCALNPQFRAGASANQSAVTFAPYFLIDNHERFNHPRRREFCLGRNELLSLFKELRVLAYREGAAHPDHGPFVASLVAERPS